MVASEIPPLYDGLLDLFAECADPERLLAYRLPPNQQARLDVLLVKNREGTLTVEERDELGEFERIEHLGRMLKARLRQKSHS